ncbi:DUF3801 domain-containing protein [Enterococcus hirae]
MDQKETIHEIYVKGVVTLKAFFQSLLIMNDKAELLVEKALNRYSTGETKLYKLLNQSDPVSVQFLSQKVDLDKIRAYLNQHDISFAFKQDENGVKMYFKTKDQKLLTEALKPILKDITKDLGSFSRKILKRPGTMSFEERLAYARKHQAKYTGVLSKAPNLKAPKMAK